MMLMILATVLTVQASWNCGSNPDREPELVFVHSHHRRLEQREDVSTWEPIRITYIYDSTFDLGTPELNTAFKTEMIDSVDQFLKRTLKVRPIIGNLSLDGLYSCGDIIEESHKSPGLPDTDLVIYVGAEASTEGWVAYAYGCGLDDGPTNNVLAGHIVMNKNDYPDMSFSDQFSTVLHEIVHVLGFSSGLYEHFNKDQNGGVYSESEYQLVKDIRGRERTLLKYPPLLSVARDIFGCPTLEGVEVEEYGGSGTAGSHWDMRIAYNDFMIGHVTDDPIYSTLTFALLESTGWYQVVYDHLQQNLFGSDEGCSFHTEKCVEDGVANFNEFCAESGPTCDYFHFAQGFCNLYTYDSDLPSHYQYFSNPKVGGSDPYIDYCPIKRGYSNTDCRDTSRSTNSAWGQTYGPNSRCAISSLLQKGYNSSGSSPFSACYELVECRNGNPIFKIGNDNVGYKELECQDELEVSWPEEFNGSLQCPPSYILCGEVPCPSGCAGYGECGLYGRCNCYPGRTGADCREKCHSSCASCSGTGENECTSCEGKSLVDGQCVDLGCDEGSYPLNGNCVPCSTQTGCTSCDSTTGYCSACDTSSYFYSEGSCLICSQIPGCSACNTDISQGCSQCNNGLPPINGSCQASCDSKCTTCSDGVCSQCVEGAEPDSEGVCGCVSGYTDQGSTCQRCANYFSNTELSAVFANAFSEIHLTFSSPVLNPVSDCSVLVTSSSLAKLGTSPVCSWSSSTVLVIQLGSGYTIQSESLSLNGQAITKEELACGSTAVDELLVTVSFSDGAPIPIAQVTGSQSYSLPCGSSSLVLSGTQSISNTNQVPSYSWSIKRNSVSISLSIDTSSDTLTIADNLLSEAVYEFTLEVTNNFGYSDTDSHTVDVTNSQSLAVGFDASSPVQISTSETKVITVLVTDSCSDSSSKTYTWSYLGADSGGPSIPLLSTILSRATHEFLINPGDLPSGFVYTFSVTVDSGSLQGSASIQISVSSGGLIAVIAKLDGQISSQVDLILDGSKSFDPSDVSAVTSYFWQCAGTSCGDSTDPIISTPNQPTITIPSSKLAAGAVYSFSLTVYKGLMSGSDSIELTAVDVAADSIVIAAPEFKVSVLDEFEQSSAYADSFDANNIAWYQIAGPSLEYPSVVISDKLSFEPETLEAGEHYIWEAKFTDEGTSVEEVFSWTTNLGPLCDGITASFVSTSSYDGYRVTLVNCIDQDLDVGSIYYSFGYMWNNNYIPLIADFSYNVIDFIFPSGTWTFAGRAYDVYGDFDHHEIEVNVSRRRRLAEEEDIRETFLKQTSDPDHIPMMILYYTQQEELTQELWELMFTTLEDYTLNLLKTDSVTFTGIIFAITQLMQEETVDISKFTRGLELIEKIIVLKEVKAVRTMVEFVLLAIDNKFPEFAGSISLIELTKQVLHLMLKSYMQHKLPGSQPLVFESDTVHIKKERMTAFDALDKSITLNDFKVTLPLYLPFDTNKIIDVTVIVIEREESDLVDVLFSESGELNGIHLELHEEEFVSVANLEVPILIEFPAETTDHVLECLALNSGEWDSKGCQIREVRSESCLVSAYHSSLFTVNSSLHCDRNYYQLYCLSGLLVLLGILIIVKLCNNSKILQREKHQEKVEVNENQHNVVEIVSSRKEKGCKKLVKNHPFLKLVCSKYASFHNIAVVFLSFISDLAMSGIFLVYLADGEIHEMYDFIIVMIFTCFVTLGVIGVIDVLSAFNKHLFSWIGIAIGYCVGGVMIPFISFNRCGGDYETDWMVLFAAAVIVDLLVSQFFIAIMKIIAR